MKMGVKLQLFSDFQVPGDHGVRTGPRFLVAQRGAENADDALFFEAFDPFDERLFRNADYFSHQYKGQGMHGEVFLDQADDFFIFFFYHVTIPARIKQTN
jgi:hypothetical protein